MSMLNAIALRRRVPGTLFPFLRAAAAPRRGFAVSPSGLGAADGPADIDVEGYIVGNMTRYSGDDSFLSGPTPRTLKVALARGTRVACGGV